MMKLTSALPAAVFCAVAATSIQAQTLNWGNEVLGDLADSNGADLDNTFVFELGPFFSGFVPTASNVDLWFSNWQLFDRASYNPDIDYFTSTVFLRSDVTSSNLTASTFSFAGLDAYIWVRDDDNRVKGTEWLLTRADNWTFPAAGGDFCSVEVVGWAVSDLDPTNVPVWGGQNDVPGSGEFTSTGNPGLQTFILIPEPTSSLLAAIAGGFVVLRRRRSIS
jgi:hypothetical protein